MSFGDLRIRSSFPIEEMIERENSTGAISVEAVEACVGFAAAVAHKERR